ncbi:RusA family crossover junction endodeoxyribonuclease, partial [Limosilactobacillus fermentum]|uniref:RusA family crossover junction endodeoxyribonuclease n=1 Tax=Limosilactobacillus fermentum TaxID=1613 RepID=UPI0021CAE59C
RQSRKPGQEQHALARESGDTIRKRVLFLRQLGMLARQQMLDRGLEPYDGPLEVCMEFYRPVQASLSQKERARRLSGVHRPTVKPDLSNYIKALEDALNGILWVDDNLIISLEAKKFYAEQPHLIVELREDVKNGL